MNQKQQKPGAIGRLEEVLAIYGASPARWPEEERSRLKDLCARDVEAKRLLAEAAALDRLLSAAPAGNASAALRSRITAAAAAEGRARVIPFDAARSRRAAPGLSPAARRGGFWPAAALAASFVFGVYLGTTPVGTGVLEAAVGTDTAAERSDALAWLIETSGSDSDLPL